MYDIKLMPFRDRLYPGPGDAVSMTKYCVTGKKHVSRVLEPWWGYDVSTLYEPIKASLIRGNL